MIGKLKEVMSEVSVDTQIQQRIAIKANNTNTAMDVLNRLLKTEDNSLSAYKVGEWLLSKSTDDMWKIVDITDIVKWVKEDLANGTDLKKALRVGEAPRHIADFLDKDELRLLDDTKYEDFMKLIRGSSPSIESPSEKEYNYSKDPYEQTSSKQDEVAKRVKEIFNTGSNLTLEIEEAVNNSICSTTNSPKQGR